MRSTHDEDDDSSDDIFIRAFSKEREKLLVSRGVPAQDLPSRKTKIEVSTKLVKIEPDIPKVPTRVISVSRQFKSLKTLLSHPIHGAYTVGISSFPSDVRAKYLALMIMNAAIDAYLASPRKHGKTYPLWHRVYGGYNDPLRDKPQIDTPCMLIISNVSEISSAAKVEKVRDLLEKFPDIPRIVVCGGEPPSNLFANRLHYPMKAGLYMGPDSLIHENV